MSPRSIWRIRVYVTPRNFMANAQHFAEPAPIQLIDGPEFIRVLHRSRKGMLLPQIINSTILTDAGLALGR